MQKISNNSYIHPSAVIIGKVIIKEHCGIFPHAVLRGDQNTITVESGSNIQDGCVIHVDNENSVHIGRNVSVGHLAMIHGATIEDNCIIGIHATVLNGATVKKGSIIGAHALVTQGMVVPENSLVLGIPGKVVKQDKIFEKHTKKNAEIYQQLSKAHKKNTFPLYVTEAES